MKTKKGLFTIILLCVILVAALYAASSSFVGTKMPNFKLRNLEGKKVKLHDAIRDKTAVINFTTVWCQDCKKLKEVLAPIIPQYKEKGVEFCFIYIGKKRKALSEGYSKDDERKGPVKLLDEKRDAAIKMKVSKIPKLFIVDKKGIIRFEGLILEEARIVEEMEKVMRK